MEFHIDTQCLSSRIRCLPALHLHHEWLFDRDPAAVDDDAFGVRQVSVVGVLKLDGVNDGLPTEMHMQVRPRVSKLSDF